MAILPIIKAPDPILRVKSKSRTGFYDLGVNKRRINTLHFRLIDIYN